MTFWTAWSSSIVNYMSFIHIYLSFHLFQLKPTDIKELICIQLIIINRYLEINTQIYIASNWFKFNSAFFFVLLLCGQ